MMQSSSAPWRAQSDIGPLDMSSGSGYAKSDISSVDMSTTFEPSALGAPAKFQIFEMSQSLGNEIKVDICCLLKIFLLVQK